MRRAVAGRFGILFLLWCVVVRMLSSFYMLHMGSTLRSSVLSLVYHCIGATD